MAAAPRTAPAADAARYAQREQADHQVASYEGGSVLVVGVSGAALIVLLLLLMLL